MPAAAPYLLFVEVAAGGVFIAGALAVSERTNGVAAALAVSPARPAAIAATRLAPLWTVTVVAAVPVLVAARTGDIAVSLAAVGLTALLLLAAGLGIANRRRTLMGFLTVVPWPLAPLLAVPLAVAAGLLTGPIWYAVPTTGALALMRGTAPYPVGLLLGYLTLWTVAAVGYTIRTTGVEPTGGSAPRSRGHRSSGNLSYVRADLRNIRRDTLIAPTAASPLLLGLLLRFAVPPLTGWADQVHGVDLSVYLPVVALLAIVLHVPVIAGMLGALAVLDDGDDGALHAIRVTPLGHRPVPGLPAGAGHRLRHGRAGGRRAAVRAGPRLRVAGVPARHSARARVHARGPRRRRQRAQVRLRQTAPDAAGSRCGETTLVDVHNGVALLIPERGLLALH